MPRFTLYQKYYISRVEDIFITLILQKTAMKISIVERWQANAGFFRDETFNRCAKKKRAL